MKKKLLFVLHSLTIGGAEMLVVQMAESLSEEYDIGILCLDKRGELWDKCEELGFWLGNVERKAGLKAENFSETAALIKDFSPDLIHAHQYTPFLFSAVARILRKTKAKIVFTEHGRHYPDVVSFKRKLANKFLSRFADKVTGVSQFSIDALREKEGFSNEKMAVVYNGLDRSLLRRVESQSFKRRTRDCGW